MTFTTSLHPHKCIYCCWSQNVLCVGWLASFFCEDVLIYFTFKHRIWSCRLVPLYFKITESKHAAMHQTVSMQIETRISLHVLAVRTSALVYRECSGLRQSLHHSMRAHCFHCLKPSRCCWALLIPCRIFNPSGLVCSHHAGRPSRLLFGVVQGRQHSAPLLQTQLHTTPPYKPQAIAVSSSSIVSTAHSVSLSLSLSLGASFAIRLLHTSPKHAGRINGSSGECWRGFRGE